MNFAIHGMMHHQFRLELAEKNHCRKRVIDWLVVKITSVDPLVLKITLTDMLSAVILSKLVEKTTLIDQAGLFRRWITLSTGKINIQRIAWFVLLTPIHCIAIYPVDSVILPLNKRGLFVEKIPHTSSVLLVKIILIALLPLFIC